jgi:formylglycine-generating enzyme required for sulfatase activity/uncharacterized protein YgiM (DUF1202 family)
MRFLTAITMLILAITLAQPATAQRGLQITAKQLEVMRTEKRVALVIGNSNYATSRLRNPVNDAKAMTIKLRSLGFEVIEKIDVERKDLRRAIREFGRRIRAGGVGLFYFAGHGVQFQGQNYIMPVGADVAEQDDIDDEGISVNYVLSRMGSARNRLNLVILDSCRNNPYAALFRSETRGLAVTPSPKGTYISYAAAPGAVAADGRGKHSPYTQAILDHMDAPGVKIEDMFKRVRVQVSELTGDKQTPYTESSLKGDFYFRVPTATGGVPPASDTPKYAIEELDDTYVVLKVANVRSGPSTKTNIVKKLSVGTNVNVTGKVRDRNRYRIALANGATAYVFGTLVTEKSTTSGQSLLASRPVPPAKPGKEAWRVILDSGLTLADWAALAEDRLKNGEFIVLIAEADAHRRRYGAYKEVARVLHGAVLGDVRKRKGLERISRAADYKKRFGRVPGLDVEIDTGVQTMLSAQKLYDKRTAKSALARLAALEKITGTTVSILGLRAKAHHVLNDYPAADAAYRAWIRKAPPDHPDRKQMALGLFKAQRKESLGPLVGETFKDCADCPEMVVIPAGSFMMGSPASEPNRDEDEGPQHRVTIFKHFGVGKFEITQAEWRSVMGTNPSRFKGSRKPVERVSWNDARAFAAKLSAKTGKQYRLLSEAEWEYAARAGTATPFHTGNRITTGQANFDGNYTYNGSSKGQDRKSTVAVGSFPSNAFGLHDMHGNVWEWVADCWNKTYRGAPADGRAWNTGDCARRVLRGGSWSSKPMYMRAADRSRDTTGERNGYNIGFRIARTLF